MKLSSLLKQFVLGVAVFLSALQVQAQGEQVLANGYVGGWFEVDAGNQGDTALIRLTLLYTCVYDITDPDINVFRFCGESTYSAPISLYTLDLVSDGEVTDIDGACGETTVCNGGTFYGVRRAVYEGLDTGALSLADAGCGISTLVVYPGFRHDVENMSVLTNSDRLRVKAHIFYSNDVTNSTPTYAGIESPYVCLNSPFGFDPGVTDAENDSLVYSLRTALTGTVSTDTDMSYLGAGISGTNPIDGISINSATGVVHFTSPAAAGEYQVVIQVDEYDRTSGNQLSMTYKDFQFHVSDSCDNAGPSADTVDNLTNATLTPPYTVTIDAGQAASFTIGFSDSAGQNITLAQAITSAIPGASAVVNSNGTGNPSIDVSWTPGVSDIGTYTFDVDAEDDACPIIGRNVGEYTVIVQGAQPLAIDSVTVQDETCAGAADGELTINTSGGVGPFGYQIQFATPAIVTINQSTPVFTGLDDNAYQVTVIDSGNSNAQVITTATVNAGASLVVTSISSSTATCPGSCTGDGTVSFFSPSGTPTFLWGSGETTQSATNLCAGSNTLSLTVGSCQRDTSVVVATNPAIVITVDSINNVSCNGGTDGGIFITATGGSGGGYTYSWTGGSTNEDLTGQSQGSYTVTVTDGAGCTETSTSVITQPVALSATASGTDPTCDGDSTGTATANPSDGTAPYTYAWSFGGQTSQTATGLPAGTYTVTVTDDNNCSTTASTTISNPAAVTASVTVDSNVSCFGFADGGLTANPGGGDGGPYTYLWDDGPASTTQSVDNLGPGTYNVTVSDNSGCTATASETITEPTALSASISLDQNVSCNGGDDGGATAAGNGGTAPYTFVWDNGEANAAAVNLDAGTHTVTVTDINGCTATEQIVITEPLTGVSASIVVDSNVTCNGFSNGGLTASGSGGTGPYNYLWSNNDVTDFTTGLAAGNYTVTVTDQNGCTATATETVTEPTMLSATASGTDPTCNGGADGTATANPSGGTVGLDYTYVWSDGASQTTQTALGLTAGTYTVTVTDDNGCTTTASTTISDPATPIVTFAPITNVGCFGEATGSVTASIPGGVDYDWSNGILNNPTITNLVAGTYTVTATDANGCTAVDDVTITQPAAALIASISNIQDVLCNGDSTGSATAQGSQGTGPYTYQWDAATGNQATQTATNLPAGTYNVTVTDANFCTAVSAATVSEPLTVIAIGLDVLTNASCNGDSSGAIQITPAGGTGPYTYVWSHGPTSEDVSNLPADTYTVTVTDQNGCDETESYVITEPAPIAIGGAIDTEVDCNAGNNGAISVNPSGGTGPYTVLWSTGSSATALNGLSGGTYSVTVTDDNLCTADTAITLVNPAPVFAQLDSSFAPSCSNDDGQAYIIGYGGQQGSNSTNDYHVIQNTTDFAPYGTDVSGAIQFDLGDDALSSSVDIGFNFDFFGNTQTSFVVASNGNIQFPGANATAFLNLATPTASDPDNWIGIWDDLNPFASGSEIIETYLGGVAPNRVRVVNYVNVPHFNQNSSLFTFQIVLHEGSNIIEFHTTSAPSVAGDNSPGKTFGIENANGTAGFAVDGRNPLPSASSVSNDYVAFIPVGQDFDFLWPDGGTDSARTDLASGDYCVTVTDPSGNGCIDTVCFNLAAPDTFDLNLTATAISCLGGPGSVTANASGTPGPFGYLWNTNETTQTISISAGGTYTVTVTDSSTNCQIVADTVMTGPVLVTLATDSTDESCPGESDGVARIEVLTGSPTFTYAWSTGVTNGPTTAVLDSITGLAPGTYTVTVTAANGCADTATITINQFATPIAVNPGSTNASCSGVNDGIAFSVPTGGTGPYTYNWITGGVTDTITGLSAGTYTVTVTDVNGCTAVDSAIVTDGAGIAFINVNTTDPDCFGANTGSIFFQASGGGTSYNFSWTPVLPATNLQAALTAGSYTVTVTSNIGCTADTTFVLTDPAALMLDTTVVNGDCAGQAASISVQVTGGTSPYSFDWNTGDTTQSITNLTTGSYSVTVEDFNGCLDSIVNIPVTSPDTLQLTPVVINDPSCAGGTDGSATVNVSGGSGLYNYLWFDNSVQDTITGLGDGTYTVTVSDALGQACSDTTSVTLVEPAGMTIVLQNLVDPTCAGGNDGEIDIDVIGGQGPYNFLWSNGNLTDNPDTLIAGSYTVTVTDANNCTEVSPVYVLGDGTSILVDVSTNNNVFCFGPCQGDADATWIGGTAPYTYEWSEGTIGVTNNTNFPGDLSGLCAGIYTITVTDANGCTGTDVDAVQDIIGASPVTATATDVSCFGSCDGTVTADTTGCIGSCTIYWYELGNGTPIDSVESLSNLCAGTYVAELVNGLGCSRFDSVVVNEPTELIGVVTPVDASCSGNNDGSASVAVSGGTPGYTFLWSTGSTNDTITGLAAGPYSVVITDLSNCTDTVTFNIDQPSTLSVSTLLINGVTCFGDNDGSASANAGGGTSPYSYVWSSGETTPIATQLLGGVQSVTVTDDSNCTASTTINIPEPTEVVALITEVQSISCFGGGANGELDASASSGGTGGLSYSWLPGGQNSASINGLSANTYCVTVTDVNGCAADTCYDLNDPTAITAGVINQTDALCFGDSTGTATATGTGGSGVYNFTWSTGTLTAFEGNLPAGTFSVIVEDANTGCSDTTDAVIGQPTLLVVSIDSTTDNQCFNGTEGEAFASAAGGTGPYNFIWSNGDASDSADSLAAGTHTVTVTDFNGCTDTISAVITQPLTGLDAAAVVVFNAPCNGDSGQVAASASGGSGSYTYDWGGGIVGDTVMLPAGTYCVTVSDGGNCTDTACVTITEPTPAQVDITIVQGVTCGGGGADGILAAAGSGGTPGYTFLWSTGSTNDTIFALNPGTYTVTMTDANGCTDVDSETLTPPTNITANIVSSSDALCFGDTSGVGVAEGLGGSGLYTYAWELGSTNDTSALPAGTWSVIVTDAISLCSDTVTVTIGQPLSPVVATVDSTNNNDCFNGTEGEAFASGSGGTGGYTFLWSNGDVTFEADSLAAGTYTVTVTDANGCTATDQAVITQPLIGLDASAITFQNADCNGGLGIAVANATGGSGNYTYDWGGGITTDTANLPAGFYCVTVSDGGNCTDTACVTITEPAALGFTSTVTPPVCVGDSNGSIDIVVFGGTAPYTVTWSNGMMGTNITGLHADTYTATVTDFNGCVFVQGVVVNDPDAIVATFTNVANSSCTSCTGDAMVNPSNGTAPYNYLWTSTETSQMATSLCSGTNTVTVTDFNGCEAEFSLSISSDGADTVTAGGTDPTCNNDCNGTVFATYNCSIAPCTVQWLDLMGTPLGTTDTLDSVCAGTYIVQLTNAGGCVDQDTIILNPANAVDVSIIASTDVSCFGGSDGTAEAVAVNGFGPYGFEWSNGELTNIAIGLSAGTNTVTVTDISGCTDTASVVISQPGSGLSVSAIVIDDVSCNGGFDGSVTAQATGGSGTYNYTWNGTTTADTLFNLPAGSYIVVVDDGGICTATDTAIVVEPTMLVAIIDSTIDPSCPGASDGIAFASAIGGTAPYNFLWPSGSTFASDSNLSDGTYCVTVTDVNGCTDVVCANIVDPAGMTNSFTGIGASSCGTCDGTATANPVGGNGGPFTYLWSTGEVTAGAIMLCGGSNTVTITDAAGCTLIENLPIQNIGADTVTAGGQDASCGACDGQVFATYNCTNAPCNVEWTEFGSATVIGTTDTVSGLCAGTYAVELTNGIGCVSIDTITISAPDPIIANETITDATCFGVCNGDITLNPTGGSGVYTFAWSNIGANTPNNPNLCAGTYTVTVSDNAGCDSIFTFTIDEPAEIQTNAVVSDVSCFGQCDGSVVLSPTNGVGTYSYNWNPVPANGNGTSQANGLCAGTYFVTVTDANGCQKLDSFDIDEPAEIVQGLVVVNDANCGQCDGSVAAAFSGGTGTNLSVQWSNGDTGLFADSLCFGLYTATVTDSIGCSQTFDYPVSETNGPTIALSGVNTSANGVCDGTATVSIITGGGTITYNWSNGDTTATADSLCAGFYSVTVTDSTGCSTVDTITITEPDAIFVTFAVTEISCLGNGCDGEITATVSGGIPPYAYVWSNGEFGDTIDSLCAGTYVVTITDGLSAVIIDSVILTDPTPVNIAATITNTTCPGVCDGSIDLSLSGGVLPYTIQWSTGDTTAMIDSLCAGDYSVTVTDSTGCFSIDSFTVTQPPVITINIDSLFNPDCQVADGYVDVSASGGTPGTPNAYSYQWLDVNFDPLTPPQNDTAASNLFAGIYNVEVTDGNGCVAAFPIILNNDSAPVITLDSIRHVSCFGLCDGIIFTTITEGTAPYNILWSSGGTMAIDSNLCAGPDTLAVSDADLCLSFGIYEVLEPAELLVLSTQQVDVTCAVDCNGEASVEIGGGTAPYAYLWSNGGTDSTINGLCSGTYTVTATDANGCSLTQVFTIAGPDTLVITLDSLRDASCNNISDGEVSVTVTGGVPPYNYEWTSSTDTLNAQDLTNILPDTYVLLVTDGNGCTISDTFVVNALNSVSVTAVGDSTVCPNAIGVQLSAIDSGAASLRWINGNGVVLGTTSTVFVDIYADTSIFVIEAVNDICIARDTVVLFESDGPGIDAGPDRTIEPGNSVAIGGSPTAADGVSVTWSPITDLSGSTEANPDANPLVTTLYYVSGTDDIGCFGIDSVLITVEKLIDPNDGFSPNGDGVNDFFTIDRIDEFPNATVEIYNRWGNLLYKSDPGYTNPWNGQFNGNTMPTGTYYYIIDLADPRAEDKITGPVTILK